MPDSNRKAIMTDEDDSEFGREDEQDNGESTEEAPHEIPEELARPKVRLKIGSELAAFGKRYGGIDLGIVRDKSPIEPAIFD